MFNTEDYVVFKTNNNMIITTILFIFNYLLTIICSPIVFYISAKYGFFLFAIIVASSAIWKLYILYKFIIASKTKITITQDNLIVKKPYKTMIYDLAKIEALASKTRRQFIQCIETNTKISLGFIKDRIEFVTNLQQLKEDTE